MRKLPLIGAMVALAVPATSLADVPYAPPPPPWRAPSGPPPMPPMQPAQPGQQPGPDQQPGPMPVVATADIVLIHGTNNGTGIDPRLGKMPQLNKPPFSSYNSYDLVKRDTMPLSLNRASMLKLPNHGDLVVTFQGVAPQKKGEPKKYIVNVSIQRRGNTILPLLQVNANAGEMLYAAVPGYRNGVLVIGIKIN